MYQVKNKFITFVKTIKLCQQYQVMSSFTYADIKSGATGATATTGTVITFNESLIYNTSASPGTGNITNSLTDAKLGIVQKIYHNDGSAPTVPAGWVLIGSGTYTTSALNIIFAEWCGGTRVEYWIVST
jgi:hypothetical protein